MSAARCAIKMRSKERDVKKVVEQLRRDLMNGTRLCVGIHSGCSAGFCTIAQAIKQSLPTTGVGSASTEEENVQQMAQLMEVTGVTEGMYIGPTIVIIIKLRFIMDTFISLKTINSTLVITNRTF